MILWMAMLAFLIALIYFLAQRRRHDEIWQRLRHRYRERRQRPSAEQPINPDFQFDRPPAEGEKDNFPDSSI